VHPLQSMSPLTERSVNTIVTVVSSFYRYHLQRGTSLSNPIVSEQLPDRFSGFRRFIIHTSRGKATRRTIKLKEPRRRVKTVKDVDFEAFLETTDNLQFRFILLLMREGGLRVGEILGLLIQDLEFHRNGVWVRRRNGLENGALAKRMVEGEERFVDLSPEFMALLDQLLLHHTFDTDHLFVVLKKEARDKWGNSTYGHPLDREAVKALFRHYSHKTGMRLDECSQLTLADIEFGERSGRVTIRSGKGNKARTVPLNASARVALTEYLAHRFGGQPTVKAVAAARPPSHARFAPLWRSQKGGTLTTSAMRQMLDAVVRDAAARSLVPADTCAHTLRHTFARNYLAENPGDIVGLATLLGHTSLDTTRIYSQPTIEHLARRIEQLSQNA